MERDAATGLEHATFRKYEPWAGRWTSPDPYLGSMNPADPQSFNRYAYVNNDPVNFVDPRGLSRASPNTTFGGSFWFSWTATGHFIGDVLVGVTDFRYTISLIPGSGGGNHESGHTGPQNPPSYDDILGPPPPIPALNVGLIATVTIGGTCGVNPVTGQPGFSRHPMGQTGNMRASIGGDGWFGARRPRNNPPRHSGIDIADVLNTTPVVAFLPGTVTFAGHTPGDGGTIVNIDHGGGITSSYVHLQQGSIPAGVAGNQPVSQGQQIGILGNTGNAGRTPPHLHFWIRLNGVLQDPEVFLSQPCPP